MSKEKAALFIDNSNIFIGMQLFTKYLIKQAKLKENQYLRIHWQGLIRFLESQNGGIDIYARHFFASLPPAADINALRERPTEEEWEKLVQKSKQSGFYKAIQNPPLNFTLHGVPLRIKEVYCNKRIRQAYYKCLDAQNGTIRCNLSLNPDECYDCRHKFLFKYEKGVDVALAVQLIMFGALKEGHLDRIILVAGDGDYKEAARYIRREVGRDLQIVSWRRPLSSELEKIGNRSPIILDDHWEKLCEIRSKAPLEEGPAIDDEESE